MAVDDEWLATAARWVDIDGAEGLPGCTSVARSGEQEDAQWLADEEG